MKKEMDIDSFMDEAVRRVKEQLGSGYGVDGGIYQKNNGVCLRGIAISNKTHAMSPVIYMEGYHMAYVKKEDMEVIVRDIIHTYEKSMGQDFPVEMLMDRKQMLDRVLFRLVNTKKNAGLLKSMPHHNLPGLGLSVIFYLMIHTEENSMEAAVTVNKGLMKIWQSSKDELLEHARKNTPEKMKAFLCSMADILYKNMGLTEDQAAWKQDAGQIPMYVLSNEKKLYGAGCMLYKGVLEQAAERLGSSFYILPSSVHEVILLAAEQQAGNRNSFRALVEEINGSDAVLDEEVLSDEVYYYDRDKKELAVAV